MSVSLVRVVARAMRAVIEDVGITLDPFARGAIEGRIYAAVKAHVDAADERAERYKRERAAALEVKTREGLTASEWLLRTGLAEQKIRRALERLRQHARPEEIADVIAILEGQGC